jgi:hypothetical protein
MALCLLSFICVSGLTVMHVNFQPMLSDVEQGWAMLESDVVEIPLLLTDREVTALETAAHDRGLTAAEMVRHVLRDFLSATRRSSAACFSPAGRMLGRS